MRKIEFFVSDRKAKEVEDLRFEYKFTRAELMRRALDEYLEKHHLIDAKSDKNLRLHS